MGAGTDAMATRIKCSKCGGSGTLPLSKAMKSTLAYVADRFTGVSAADVSAKLGLSQPAASNRLERLRVLKLVVRLGKAPSLRYHPAKHYSGGQV